MASLASDVFDYGHTQLVRAAARGNDALLREIYSARDDWTSDFSRTALRQALQRSAAKGAISVVRQLLEWNVDLEPRQNSESSALFKAVENRHPLVVEHLLLAGANPNWHRPRDGLTALFIAFLHQSPRMVNLLLQAGANSNARSHEGRTPLLHAAMVMGRVSVWNAFSLVALLGKGADIHARDGIGRTALHWAAANGNTNMAEDLLKGVAGVKANIHATSKRGMEAVYLAAEKGHGSIVRILLQNGAHVRAVGNNGWTALHLAAKNGHLDVAHQLLDAGADINARLPNGTTPLHWAAMSGHKEVVELFLAHPEVNYVMKDNFDRTPLLSAAEKGQRDIVILLSRTQAVVDFKLSPAAEGACRSFDATVVDFGVFRDGKNRLIAKHSVYNLLYDWDMTANKPTIPLSPRRLKYQPTFRWVHLPTNNIAWVEDNETFRALSLCLDQEQHGPLPHHHAMRPYFQHIVPPSPDAVAITAEPPNEPKRKSPISHLNVPVLEPTPTNGSLVLFMPFVHYETGDQHQQAKIAIELARRSKGKDVPDTSSPDTLLLNGYMNHERPVHIRRTLDQYFYSSTKSSNRDVNQVIYRYCQKYGHEPRLLMVDQLWLWILGKDLVITCFAERWEWPKRDPLNVLDSIMEAINIQKGAVSVYHLASIIFSQCCNAFDGSRVDQEYEFLDMFENSIGSIVSRQAELLLKFDLATKKSTRWLRNRQNRGLHSGQTRSIEGEHDSVLDSLLGLADESAILNEINEIREELNIIQVILDTQTALLGTMDAAVAEELRQGNEHLTAVSGNNNHALRLKRQWQAVQRQIDTRQRDLQRMDRRAENIYTGLRSLLELKQMQSNALEAKFARDQAISASKQGQAVLIFTVVTIVFLPVSFIATLFTINLDVWSSPLQLSYVAKYIFGIGLGISIPLVIMALTVTDIKKALVWFVLEIKGFFTNRWKRDPSTKERVMV